MPKKSAEQPLHTGSEKLAMLEIAWEMTKLYVSARPDSDITQQSLRDEFTKNAEVVYTAWGNLGNNKGGR